MVPQTEIKWWDKNAVYHFDKKKGREKDNIHFAGNRDLGPHL